jgi:signal transduction histidine kinase
MAGQTEQRLPMIGFAPELDDLARNLNRMLDRIEGLMAGLKQVSTDVAHDLRTP